VVLEPPWGWYWAADVLEEAGARVHLAHPLGVKGFENRRVKNDDKDAALLADLRRMGSLPESWIAPRSLRELRELVRYRHKLSQLRTGLKSQVPGKPTRRCSTSCSPAWSTTKKPATTWPDASKRARPWVRSPAS
jgi:transposase